MSETFTRAELGCEACLAADRDQHEAEGISQQSERNRRLALSPGSI